MDFAGIYPRGGKARDSRRCLLAKRNRVGLMSGIKLPFTNAPAFKINRNG